MKDGLQFFDAPSRSQSHRSGNMSAVFLSVDSTLWRNELSHARNRRVLCSYKPDPAVVTCFQAQTKATAKDEKSWTEVPGVDPPVRLVVNATSQSQVSSNPILDSEAAPGRVCKTS